jgi:hypothetical protein
MLNDLKCRGVASAEALEAIRSTNVKILNGRTHGGSHQLRARIADHGISINVGPEYMAAIVRHAAHNALLAAIAVAQVAGRMETLSSVVDAAISAEIVPPICRLPSAAVDGRGMTL